MTKAAKKFVARENVLDSSIAGASGVFCVDVTKAAVALKQVREEDAEEEVDAEANDEARRILALLRDECQELDPQPAVVAAPTRYEEQVAQAAALLN